MKLGIKIIMPVSYRGGLVLCSLLFCSALHGVTASFSRDCSVALYILVVSVARKASSETSHLDQVQYRG